MQRKHLKQDIRRYLTSSGFISILDVVRTLVVAKLLGPYFAGLCTTLMVIPQVVQYLNLGTIEALTVFVPQYKAEGMMEQARHLKNSTFNYTVITSGASAFLVILYAMLFSPARPFVNQSISLAASLIFLWETKQFLVTNYAAEGNFLRLSWVEFFFTLFAAVFQLANVYYSREYGFWTGLIAANLLIIGFSMRDYFKENGRWQPTLDRAEIKKILPLGFVMIIASVSYAPFIILARVFLAGTIGVHEVGLFLLSIIIISKLSVIPMSISKVVLPHMSYAHGKERKFQQTFDLFTKAQLYTLALSLLLVVAGYFVIRPVISFLLPQYLSGIPAAKMMLFAAIPYCLVDNANNVLLALQHKRTFIFNLLMSLMLQTVIFAGLYLSGNVSSWTVSASLLFVFTCYALLANYKVFQLQRQSSLAKRDPVYV